MPRQKKRTHARTHTHATETQDANYASVVQTQPKQNKSARTHARFFLFWFFVCSPEGVRAHAKGARAGHESSADLAS